MLRAVMLLWVPLFLGACAEEGGGSPSEDLALGMEAPAYTPVGGAGSPCRTDADCADAYLVCDLSLPGNSGVGICTQDCEDDPDPSVEAAACQDEASTCLAWEEGGTGLCTPACDTEAAPGEAGACAAHQICTGHGLWRVTDTAGCLPFCQDDTGCGPYQSCDTRTGTCVNLGEGERPERLPDGHPCDPRAYDDEGRSTECRGSCIDVGAGGLCTSFVDLARTQTCPDDPERITPRAVRGDNYAVCAFAICASDEECVEGTSCQSCLFGGRCCMP